MLGKLRYDVTEESQLSDLNTNRLAFAIIDGKLRFIDGDESSHSKWLEEDFGITDAFELKNVIMGHIENDVNAIYLYKNGSGLLDAADLDEVHKVMLPLLALASLKTNIDAGIYVYGSILGEDDDKCFNPQRLYDFLNPCAVSNLFFVAGYKTVEEGVAYMTDSFATLYNRVDEVASRGKKVVEHSFMKLAEEVGELSEALLSSAGVACCAYKEKTDIDVIEELSDCIICLLDIATIKGISPTVLSRQIMAKLGKWNAAITREKV